MNYVKSEVVWLFSMRRAGHTAVMDWLDRVSDQKRFRPHVRPFVDLSVEAMEIQKKAKDKTLFNCEDQSFKSISKTPISKLPAICVIRDPFNWLASRKNHKDAETKKIDKEKIALYKEYINEYTGKTNYLKNKVFIIYNKFIKSEEYRKEVCKSLELDFKNDTDPFKIKSRASSFKKLKPREYESRYKAVKLPDYVISDKQLYKISKDIFDLEVKL
jgi:hypothetical protein